MSINVLLTCCRGFEGFITKWAFMRTGVLMSVSNVSFGMGFEAKIGLAAGIRALVADFLVYGLDVTTQNGSGFA